MRTYTENTNLNFPLRAKGPLGSYGFCPVLCGHPEVTDVIRRVEGQPMQSLSGPSPSHPPPPLPSPDSFPQRTVVNPWTLRSCRHRLNKHSTQCRHRPRGFLQPHASHDWPGLASSALDPSRKVNPAADSSSCRSQGTPPRTKVVGATASHSPRKLPP